MVNYIVKILKKINETAKIDLSVYDGDGKILYASSDFVSLDFNNVKNVKEIAQFADKKITVLPLTGGYTVVLRGDGETYLNYAALIKAAVEGVTEPKKELTLNEKLKLYLSGELESGVASELASKYSGLFDGYVLTLVTDARGKLCELKNFLETMRESGDIIIPYDERSIVFIKSCGEEDEYQSATDFAFTLYDNIKEELRIDFVINVGGTVHSFSELSAYFHRCMLAYEFGKMMSPNVKIYSYKEYIMIKMLSEIPYESLCKYLDTLLDRDSADILDDTELMITAEEFLKNSLNISETSRSMYMHRNTLIYRLDKIEKATGLNLRHFNDAVAFRLLTILNKLVKNKDRG